MSLWSHFVAWLEPPSPYALGRTQHEFEELPFRSFRQGEPDAYAWEDWRDEVSAKYPVRFWLTNTLPYGYFYPWLRTASNWWEWLMCHLLPSRRFHLIDVRNPGPGIHYTHGWRDKPDMMLWSWMVLLRDYVENEQPVDPASWASPEELAEPGLAAQKAEYDEAIAIYNWWMHGRVEEEEEEQRLLDAKKQFFERTVEWRMATDAWFQYRTWRSERDDEMLRRLVAIRRRMWT